MGHTFQPDGDVNSVAINVVTLYDDVTDVYADPIFERIMLLRLALTQGSLDCNRALDRLNGAWELNQHSIAHQLYYAALVFRDEAVDYFMPNRLECSEGRGFICGHPATITNHICGKNGS